MSNPEQHYHPGITIVTSDTFLEKYGKPRLSDVQSVNGKLRVPTESDGIFEIDANGNVQRAPDSKYVTMAELLGIEFPQLVWYTEKLITTGLTLFWGYAKSGKSIAILHMLLGITSGGRALGTLKVNQCSALLISLEDGPRRLKGRLVSAKAIPNDNFHIFFDWPRGEKGVARIAWFLDQHPEIKIVVIDTLFLLSRPKDGNDYTETVVLTEKLKRIADDRDVAIIAIHHSKKQSKYDSGDFAESALGSTGLVSGPDHLIYLKRTPKGPSDAVLFFRSKDAEPAEMALDFDRDIAGWVYRGEISELAETDERQEILNILKENDGPMTTGDIHKSIKTEKTKQAVSNLLGRMVEAGNIERLTYGVYRISTGGSKPPFNPFNCVTTHDQEQ